ncbi:MAG: helix-turn-helix transcriptional regulator [Oscillospiraceae bacterium]|nr:helix-turn-helix transcriptional regulator [Oscillospiraceae bacterium]MBR5070942.1 helix-turn-helix transcriptional regulator [Oscillospiraceae bacterium]
MDPAKTGALIAELRKENHLTQLELARLLNVSDKAVSRWETGRGMPDLSSLEALSSALDVSVAELIKGDRMAETVSSGTFREMSSEGLSMAKDLIRKRKIINTVSCVVISLLLLFDTLVFFNSPVYMEWSDGLIAPEISADGRITAILPEGAAGFEIDTCAISGAEGLTETYISCYRTVWSMLTRNNSMAVALLGDSDTTGCVRYFPGPDIDVVIYTKPGLELPYGTIHLPNYPYSTAAKVLVAVIVLSLVLILRKDGLSISLWSTCPGISRALAAVLWSRIMNGKLYDRPFYHAGYLLLATLISVALSVAVDLLEKRKTTVRRERNS